MITKNKPIDFPSWSALCFLLFVSFFAAYNFAKYIEDPLLNVIVADLLVIISCICAGTLRYRFPRLADCFFAILVSAYLYKIWPHMFFDDAGFIIRYLEQLNAGGYWFQFNGGEGAIFGISGFIHGLYSSLLVKFVGMSPERALHISNLTGLALCLYFISGIFRYFLQKPSLAYLSAFIVVCFTKSWGDVLFTGMETPIHVSLVLAAFYFLVYGYIWLFYFSAALAIISKLDAVPVMAVLFLFHGLLQLKKLGLKTALLQQIKPQLLCFWSPLVLWIAFSTWLFGSPFPQSAKAKMLYHSGKAHSFFPFLDGFTVDAHKYPMLWLLLILLGVHVLYTKKIGLRAITVNFGFGWMFVAIMALYYFYNPNERMLWYYALPDLLLTAQCVLSTLWIASLAKDWKGIVLPFILAALWIFYLKPDTDGGKKWMSSYLQEVELERYEIGTYISKEATAQDTLISWHGLISRNFPGYVLDGTGLNSKLAVDYKLNKDTMLAIIKPDYGIHHGFDDINSAFAKHGYFIKGMFGDITIRNWPAWIWWEKRDTDMQSSTLLIADEMVEKGRIMNPENPLKIQGRSVIVNIPTEIKIGVLWAVFEGRGSVDSKIKAKLWANNKLLQESEIDLPAYGKEGYPSLFTVGKSIPFAISHSDSSYQLKMEFLPTGEDTVVKINNLMIEYPH